MTVEQRLREAGASRAGDQRHSSALGVLTTAQVDKRFRSPPHGTPPPPPIGRSLATSFRHL